MNKQLLVFLFFLPALGLAQPGEVQFAQNDGGELFGTEEPLEIKLQYSIKELKKQTNDSVYLPTVVSYLDQSGNWIELEARIRTRGNFRLENCYFPPVKIKIKKKIAKGTVFDGNRSLKMVFPCLRQNDKDDNVVKELMAYKIYENVSPYHFKTRLLNIELTELRGGDDRVHQVRGFFIEDVDQMAERYGGKELERKIHPLEQDNICSARNDFFQFMIGNTDFSIAYQHNEKLIYAQDMIIPVPYDFDMSGLVNASYSRVSVIGDEKLPISRVTDRMYRGFKRTDECYEEIRVSYLDRHDQVMAVCRNYEGLFRNYKEFDTAIEYLEDFYGILQNERLYKQKIIAKARVK